MELELVIVRGLPGSGKTTYAKKNYPDYLHYEPDHCFCDVRGVYRYEHQLWTLAQEWVYKITDVALSKGESVVVSDVFPRRNDYEQYADLAAYWKANLTVHTTRTNLKGASVHRVPVHVICHMAEMFEKEMND